MTNHTLSALFASSRLRHRAARIGLTLAAAAAVIAVPAVASAHVTVQPDEVEGGGFSVVSFRVPNERDNAATTKVRVLLPTEQPLASVQTTPVPGWKVTTEERTLAKPVEMFGSQVSRVVSEVIWTATDGGLRPGQFQDFDVSLGQLPRSGELVFKAQQTYSSGEQVNWNEVAVGDAEPEHPAPALTLTGPPPEAAKPATGGDPTAQPDTAARAGHASHSGASSALPVGLSVAALVISVAALALAWKRPTG